MVGGGIYTLRGHLSLPLRMLVDKLDVFHATTSLDVPLASPCPLVVTFHDLLLKVAPEFLPSIPASVYFNVVNWRAVSSASKIITVSVFTAKELVSLYPWSEAKVSTVYSGIGQAFRPVGDQAVLGRMRKKYGLRNPYCLYIGTYKRHKNLETLVKAYGQLPRKILLQWDLVLVGKEDGRFPEVPRLLRELGIEPRVIRLKFVEEEDLPALYSGADVFVLPSLYEGFGFPLLEAMACGVPVVAARISSLNEVGQGAALWVDPLDASQMAAAIEQVLSQPDLRLSLRAKGLARAGAFSWLDTAERVLEIYESVARV